MLPPPEYPMSVHKCHRIIEELWNAYKDAMTYIDDPSIPIAEWGHIYGLSPMGCIIFDTLLGKKGSLVTYQQILARVPESYVSPDDSLKVQMHRVRDMTWPFGYDIENSHGSGYVMTGGPEDPKRPVKVREGLRPKQHKNSAQRLLLTLETGRQYTSREIRALAGWNQSTTSTMLTYLAKAGRVRCDKIRATDALGRKIRLNLWEKCNTEVA